MLWGHKLLYKLIIFCSFWRYSKICVWNISCNPRVVPLSSYSLALACKLANLQFRLILKLSSVAFCHNLQCCTYPHVWIYLCSVTKKKKNQFCWKRLRAISFIKSLFFKAKLLNLGLTWTMSAWVTPLLSRSRARWRGWKQPEAFSALPPGVEPPQEPGQR